MNNTLHQLIKKGSISLFFLFILFSRLAAQSRFRFVFATDIHLMPANVEAVHTAIDSINRLSPDFVITGGDLVKDAMHVSLERADTLYQLYLSTIKRVICPVYNTMGNHELFGVSHKSKTDTSHPMFGKRMYEQRIGRRYYSFDHKGWHFVILDGVGISANRKKYFGYVDSLQIAWLQNDLSSIKPETPVCVSVHLPLISVFASLRSGPLSPMDSGLAVINAKEVLKVFNGYNLRLVLQGHTHFVEAIETNDVLFLTGGAVAGGRWKGPIGNTKDGFMVIDIDGEKIFRRYVKFNNAGRLRTEE